MHIILTHEQADFDALASTLGAYLLDGAALPVLPRRVNRNVRAFLTLYGMDLPFVDPRDLPNEPVESVTLVDTQSLISVKGMNPKTRIHIVDHHPPREDLPENWTLETEAVGATTTVFVETLRERGDALPLIPATLMLLGIYEDTGSLTYARTTARDLSAAAYLLEQGASLEIAATFLQHPLSPDQQALYEHLLSVAETHHFHGHTVIITRGDAREMDEEISTLAHKLRDLLEPDGLFLLVRTRGGVQIVARSTDDRVDVGAVAAHFGGGGHARAAAALVHLDEDQLPPDEDPLEKVRTELLQILPDHIRPAITVAEIMSQRPQVISPDTPVQEAALRMQRYGYEGYPVVQDGRVVGLLTRRAVDRALAHQLNLTAGSLMKAGEVTVRPDDSIEHLQNLMIDTGWGQIPVVDPDTGKITGIVTRTDLIQTLTPEAEIPGRRNLADRLKSALPPARLMLLKTIAEAAHQQHAALYIVGGFVRDLLLERPSTDFDLVVEGDAIALTRALARDYGGRVTSHSRFGTAKWHIGPIRRKLVEQLRESSNQPEASISPEDLPETLDLVTARTELYRHPTALPTVERGSIKLDLHRRDFTINTLALRLDGWHYGELYDYWGGLSDLRQGLVRALHSLSFVDDPTRMLRAVRFEQRFGFRIEDRTLDLLLEARPLLDRVSGDRIRHELDAILDEEQAASMLKRLDELGLLKTIHPELEGDAWLYNQIVRLGDASPAPEWGLTPDFKGMPLPRALGYTLWLIRRPPDRARSAARRLKFPRELESAVLAAARLWPDLPGLAERPPSKIVARLDEIPPLARYAAYLAADQVRVREALQKYVKEWQHIAPITTGHDLRARGLPPGPIYRQILNALRAAWLDGEIQSAEEEAKLLERWIEVDENH